MGALFFTMGERHGFTINEKGTDDTPHYVIAKDIKKNTITVTTHEAALDKDYGELHLDNVHWISGVPMIGGNYTGQIRYHGKQKPFSIIGLKGKNAVIRFLENTEATAIGQSFVMYDGTKCLGGGIVSTNSAK
jgi:tRNA-specific 2-thiouridylase